MLLEENFFQSPNEQEQKNESFNQQKKLELKKNQ
jgi:hypothetical protein